MDRRGAARRSVQRSVAVHTLTLNIPSLLLYAMSRPRATSSAGVGVMCLWAVCVTRHVLTRRPNARIFRETNACTARMYIFTRAKMTQGISLARIKMQSNERSCQNCRVSKRPKPGIFTRERER